MSVILSTPLLFTTLMHITLAWRNFDVILWNVTCEVNESKVKKADCSLIKNEQNQNSLSVHLTLLEDTYLGNIEHKTFFTNNDGLVVPIFKHQFNGCEFLEDLSDLQDMMLHLVLKKLRQAQISNLPTTCPLQKDTEYYIRNFPIDAEKFPHYMPALNFNTSVVMKAPEGLLLRMVLLGEFRRKA